MVDVAHEGRRRWDLRVAVLVDDLDPDRRRHCFWDKYFEGEEDVELTLVSLMQSMHDRIFFNVYKYDVIIFNWCVIDGALMYAADRAQAIVKFYDDHFREFVRRGGVLIMENQPKRWRPSQDAYDVLFRDEIWVKRTDRHVFGSSVRINERFKKHPLLQHLDEEIHSSYTYPLEMSWFPVGSTSAKSIEELQPTKMYSGAFDRWTPEWLPVIYGDHTNGSPVMLLKTEGEGLWVVTTMYLASSGARQLIDGVVRAERRMGSIRKFHEAERRHRRVETGRLVLGVGVGAFLFYSALRFDVIGWKVPFADSLGGNVAVTAVFAAVGTALAIVRDRIFRSLRSINNR